MGKPEPLFVYPIFLKKLIDFGGSGHPIEF